MIDPVIYLLINNHRVVYVGQTLNFKQRIRQHKNKIYDRVRLLKCPVEDLWRVELDLIYRLEPMYNKSTNTNHSRSLSLIKERNRLQKIVDLEDCKK